MNLPALTKASNKVGKPAVVEKFLSNELKNDLLKLANTEIGHKIVFAIQKFVDRAEITNEGVSLNIDVVEKRYYHPILQRIKALSWADASVKTIKNSSYQMEDLIILKVSQKAIQQQLKHLKRISESSASNIVNHMCIKLKMSWGGSKSEFENEDKKLTKSVLTSKSFTPLDLHIKKNVKYTLQSFENLLHHSINDIKYHPAAIRAATKVLEAAKSLSSRPIMAENILFNRDLELIEKNLFPAAVALSALHANPNLQIKFNDNGFVLFDRLKPVGRFGPKLDKMSMKEKFARCKKECGSFSGKERSILDVLDAEGKKKDKQLKELFDDLAKHLRTHSGGTAARTTRKLRDAVGVTGKIDWTIFKKSLDEGSKRVKDLGYDPMVKRMEKTVKEIHAGRSVLPISSMKWDKIFEKKDFDWIGALTADVLEDEVNSNPQAMEALSNVANWMENTISCKLDIRVLGSEGVKISFVPAKPIHVHKWKLELQDIMKKGPKWSKK